MTEFQLLLELLKPMQESIGILNDHSGILTADMAVLKNQMSEIMFWGRAIGIGVAGIIVERIVNGILVYKKNGKKK